MGLKEALRKSVRWLKEKGLGEDLPKKIIIEMRDFKWGFGLTIPEENKIIISKRILELVNLERILMHELAHLVLYYGLGRDLVNLLEKNDKFYYPKRELYNDFFEEIPMKYCFEEGRKFPYSLSMSREFQEVFKEVGTYYNGDISWVLLRIESKGIFSLILYDFIIQAISSLGFERLSSEIIPEYITSCFYSNALRDNLRISNNWITTEKIRYLIGNIACELFGERYLRRPSKLYIEMKRNVNEISKRFREVLEEYLKNHSF